MTMVAISIFSNLFFGLLGIFLAIFISRDKNSKNPKLDGIVFAIIWVLFQIGWNIW